MATTAQTATQFTERVNAPDELVRAIGAARVRKLHAAILRACTSREPLTIRLQPREPGRAPKLTVAAEEEIL